MQTFFYAQTLVFVHEEQIYRVIELYNKHSSAQV